MKKYIFSLLLLLPLLLSACVGGGESTAGESIPEISDDGRTVIVLDAGHGFGDPGCGSEYMVGTEAEVTLDMVNRLKDELVSLGAEVILTHDGEAFPASEEIIDICVTHGIDYREDLVVEDTVFSAYERGVYVLALSKETPIDMFVSLHVNSFPTDPTVDRYELYYYEGNPYSALLNRLCVAFSKRLDNKTKIAPLDYENAYIVTKYGDYPSVLVETGYASNESAAQKLNSPAWRAEFCKALAEEIIKAVK
ncbi:MAG: N-acetylmuramoyl-L-alanine amidase [Clostridia bacterium]|nr:N-acetylmuramoyl-L-alanine amidase [Clostridia bacterium]